MSEPPRSPAEAESALAPGTRLGEFELRGLLGVGGFGIVYRAFDHQLEREVAIKEYMPASMAGRTETMHVSLRSRSDAEVFSLGLRSFVNEAKLLARFDHPSLLKVYRFWEANGTAYMAMPVLRGQTLKELRRSAQPAPIDEAWLRRLLEPLLGALETLHAEGVYHRDIAPDNIEIEPDGHPVLLDFGAARRVISDKTQTLTAILKPAYAPVEQYAEAGSVRQGPWTDLYALGATVHYLLLGRAPAPATARVVADDQAPLSSHRIDGCSEEFLHIVDWMLAPRPGDRPQNVAALRAALRGEVPPPQPHAAQAAALAPWERTVVLSPAAMPAAAGPPAAGPDEPVTLVMPRPMTGGTRVSSPAAGSHAGVSDALPMAAMSGAVPASAQPAVSSLPAEPEALPGVTPSAAAPAGPVASPRRARAGAPAAAPPGDDAVAAGRSVPRLPGAAAPGSRSKAPALALGACVVLAAAAAWALWSRQAADGTSAPPASAAAALSAAPASAAAGRSTASGAPGVPGAPGAPDKAAAPRAPAASSASVARSPAQGETALAASTPALRPPPTAPTAAAALPGKPLTPAAATPPRSASGPAVGNAPARNPALKVAPARPPEPARPDAALPSAGPAAPPQQPAAAAGAEPAASARPAAPPAAAAAPPVEPAKPLGPAAICGSRSGLSHFLCMERECLRSEFASHADCLKWHEGARQRN